MVTSNVPGPVTSTGQGSLAAQSTALRSSFQVIDAKDFPRKSGRCPREVDDPALARFARVDSGNVGFGFSWKNLFHRQVGIGRDQGQGRVGVLGLGVEAGAAVDDAFGVFEAGEKRVRLAQAGDKEFCIRGIDASVEETTFRNRPARP